MKYKPGVNRLWALLLGALLCSGNFFVHATERFASAELLEARSQAISIYGQLSKTKPVLELSGVDVIAIPTSGGSASIFSASNAELKMEQEISNVVAAFEFRPHEDLSYKFKLGQVREFDLEYSSGSQTNRLQASNDGYIWGFGLSGQLAPGSIVSTAISWGLNYTQTIVNIDRFEGGPVVYVVDQRWRQEEFQGSLSFGRRIKQFEPYGGIKITRVMNSLRDDETKASIKGKKDGFVPFIGIEWLLGEKERIVIEGSFVDENSLTAGLRTIF